MKRNGSAARARLKASRARTRSPSLSALSPIYPKILRFARFRAATKAMFINLNPQLRINFARFYSLCVGIWGGATLVPTVEFVAGFSIAPAIFRFGDSGQHEIRFWIGSPAAATTPGLKAGTVLLLLLSYAYVF